MPSEGVVDALRKVHRSLRGDGLLLDVHPQPRPPSIELRTGAGTTDLGPLAYSADFIRTLSHADGALVSLEQDGTFRNEREVEFSFPRHFKSLSAWREYLAKEAQYYVPPDATMSDAIGRALATAGTELVVREWARARRFARLP